MYKAYFLGSLKGGLNGDLTTVGRSLIILILLCALASTDCFRLHSVYGALIVHVQVCRISATK